MTKGETMKKSPARRIIFIFAGILAMAALSCSSISDVSSLFATNTPTPTLTFTPSPTLTPSPTFTPSPTPSPSPTAAPAGSKTEKQADGSTLFTDIDNSYQVSLPKGWTILPLSSEDMAQILQSMSDKNPEFKKIADNFKNLDPDVIRVMALNLDSKYIQSGASPSLSVIAIDNKVMTSMPLDFVMEALEESFKQQGGEALSSSTLTNANGVEMGSFEYIQNVPSPMGGNVQVRYKTIIFKAADKMIMVQLGTPKQFADEFLSIMDQIKDSVKLLEE
jgi:hypothetical protein